MATTPTVRRLQLGNELRRVRENAGRTPTEAATVLDCAATKISRMELGQSPVGIGDLKLLLEYYGDEPDHIASMLELGRNTKARGRWTGYRAIFPDWFRMYFDLEQDASDIKMTEAEVVPGQLQTDDYVRALYASHSPAEIDDRLKARQERRSILTRENPPTISFVLSESCLHRAVGDTAVMRGQLDYLVAMSKRRNIHIQVLPFDAQTPMAGFLYYGFTLLTIDSPGNASALEFVYVEDLDDARYLDGDNEKRPYVNLWGRLQAAALGPVESRKLIRNVAEQFT
ncbi:helix-turn-helix domain-containing protein [Amycolatopsis sp. H20-H5]|uniref:helix-turn-helix domain-containing protein n=1 Tax=Amycolatopsis sp. H20-H5 TaxID=3046309 RepID=UPI002DB86412|nr:helix-turn-helix transcriptional regulator [Amycolatopsis sp. H20-H5]MEC3976139.1 helix-turn-helix transcriptional regulator [Amycolatopsis sp. H20-H5]